jgi:DNA-binding transcriptional LysR family regulator
MALHLYDVAYFLHAVDGGSLLAGARRAHVTPPAMTKAIHRLEDELGATLFVRSTRGAELTGAGSQLVPALRALLAEAEGIRALARGRERTLGGELRVMAMEVFSPFLLPRALARLVRHHPAVVPRAYEGIPERMAELVATGRIDVAFTIGATQSPSLSIDLLGTSPGLLVCGRSHPLRSKRSIGAPDVAAHPSVVPRFWGLEHLPSLDQFPDDVWPRRVGATIELLRMGVALVQEGVYLGYFPEISIRNELAARSLFPLRSPPAPPFQLAAMLPRARARPEALELVEEVRALVGRRRAAGSRGAPRTTTLRPCRVVTPKDGRPR